VILLKRLILIILFMPLSLFADELDEGLPSNTPEGIEESIKKVSRLGVENKAIVKITATMLESSFSEQQVLKAHEILIKAKEEDLPEGPLMDKIYEGVSKRIQAEKILQAMEKVRSRYGTANDYAQRITRDREQVRKVTQDIAECMAAGMVQNDMARIAGMLQQRRNEMNLVERKELNKETLRTVRNMARTGARSEEITNVVDNSFQRAYGSGEMRQLGIAFMNQATMSSSPSELAKRYSNAIKRGVPPDNIGPGPPPGLGPFPGADPAPFPGADPAPFPGADPGPGPGQAGDPPGGFDGTMGPGGGPPPGGPRGGGGGPS
jgi:hypothetical protein